MNKNKTVQRSRDELETETLQHTSDLEKEILIRERAEMALQLDIDERKATEKAMQRSEAHIRAILDTVVDGIISINDKGLVQSFNPAAERIFGYSADEVIGNNVNMLMPEPFHTEHDSYLTNFNNTGKAKIIGIGREVVGKRKNGATFPLDLAIKDMEIDGKRAFTGIIRDITERRADHIALLEAKNQAEQASRAKSEFLSSMSHELRTPLNAILGFAELFEFDESLKYEQKRNAREIYKAGEHLLSLINEVLDLSKIESGHIELSKDNVPLLDVINECYMLLTPFAESHNISMELVATHCNKLVINADYTRFKQVILNLISNAVKYNNAQGHVTISCAILNTELVRISVKDTGCGMSQEQLNKLYQPFHRMGGEFSKTEGTGIGLVITKQLTELMDGSIGVESQVGKGSTFWVDMKIAVVSAEEIRQMTEKDNEQTTAIDFNQTLPPEARILIAEDNVANQTVFRQQFELLGYQPDIVENGIRAWDRLQNGNYDILLSDIHMPLMDGYELISKIRESEQHTGKHLAVIAITANAMEEDIVKCLEHGMDGFVSKPVSFNELKVVMQRWLRIDSTVSPETNEPDEKDVGEQNTGDDDTGSNAKSEIQSEASRDTDEDSEPCVDMSMLISLIGNDKDRHCKLFKTFIDSTPVTIHEIQQAHKEHQCDIIMQRAHKLKSPARSMGVNALADACQHLEEAAHKEQWEKINFWTPRLQGLFESAEHFIENYCTTQPVTKLSVISSIETLKILLVDDDQVMLDVETMMLNELGINDVITAISAQAGLDIIDDSGETIEVIICDLNMPEMDGVEFLRHLSNKDYSGGVVIASGEDARILKTAERLAGEHRLNVLGVLEKPITQNNVKRILDKLEQTSSKAKAAQSAQPQIMITVEELKHGIENNEMMTYFQPKVDVLTRNVIGVETLVRWQHPEKGLIAPFFFIQMAEENGLIDVLTQVIFQQALQHAADLHAMGFTIKVAVNISVDTLSDLSWPDYAVAQTSRTGVDPSNIVLEITESRLMDNLTSALEILTRLSLKKFSLSIDDFGTGYSSMEQLQRIPFSELKIDRAFVNGAANDTSSRAILESSVQLARKLGMTIVAEGVETQQDWDLIAELGCDQVQGYFIAKPMSIDQLKLWLDQWQKPGQQDKK